MLQRLAAEGLGSLLLAATVIGSGIMAAQLSARDPAVALLANTFATEAILAVLFNLLGPISGAHFDPAVSVVQALRGEMKWRNASAYSITQIVGYYTWDLSATRNVRLASAPNFNACASRVRSMAVRSRGDWWARC